jgi:hypothetical protein
MAENGLANGKAKFDEAMALMTKSELDWALIEQMLGDALYIAGESLVAFRREGKSEKKVEALDLVVEANVALGDTFAAFVVAQDELAMARRTGEKKSMAKLMDILGRVQVIRDDSLQALDTFTELKELQKELGDKEGEAKATRFLAEQNLSLNRVQKATKLADEALEMFKALGSKDGEDEAKLTRSRIWCAMKMPDKAPNRAAAKDALKDLSAAIGKKDTQAWNAAMEALQKTGAWVEKDLEDVKKNAAEADAKGAKAFLAEVGQTVDSKKEISGGALPHEAIEVTKRITYIQFRLGGLGYGPRFRCLQAHGLHLKCAAKEDYENNMKALAVLQVSDEADDWEKELGFQPGILDGMLQSLSGMC